MRRLTLGLSLTAILLAACAGASTPAPGSTQDPGAGPTVAPPTEGPTADPGSTDGGVINPGDILAGEWKSGSVEVQLRDGYDASFTLDLQPGSFTAAGTSYLAYGDGTPWIVQVVFEGETGDGFVLTGPVLSGGGTDDGNCTFQVDRNDSSAIEARIECTDTGGIEGATVHESLDVKLTVRASR